MVNQGQRTNGWSEQSLEQVSRKAPEKDLNLELEVTYMTYN